ncbi:hypothetical protein GE061_006470 [Apolygus lucorum]|uniref:Uncharacterized protein n=1 Tax=Apolygus lucorum TaxID=248454 RepID=A0A8S9WVB8_APOLU|nr:hypothetical protein GE061_006470 [Apolygus lucorum]
MADSSVEDTRENSATQKYRTVSFRFALRSSSQVASFWSFSGIMGKVQDEVPLIDSPQTDASTLLAAALQQMDGIISGVGLEGVERSSPVELAAERLVSALQAYPVLPPPPDPHKANIIRLWIQQVSLHTLFLPFGTFRVSIERHRQGSDEIGLQILIDSVLLIHMNNIRDQILLKT